jgi:hypothetical protein
MNKVQFVLDSNTMKLFIKDLLSLRKGSIWIRDTIDTNLAITFSGDNKEVQKEVYNWLSVPERKQFFEGGK